MSREPGSGAAIRRHARVEPDGTDPPNEYHPYDHSFASVPRPDFIAVDASGGPSNGDIYVADNGSQVVRKYDPAGNLITSWADNGGTRRLDDGEGPFGKISGLASASTERSTSASTKSSTATDELFEFDEDGNFDSEHALEGAIQPVGISVDGDGNVFYVSYSEPSSATTGSPRPKSPTGGIGSGPEERPRRRPQQRRSLSSASAAESLAKYSFDSSGRVSSRSLALQQRLRTDRDVRRSRGRREAGGLAVEPSNGDAVRGRGRQDPALRLRRATRTRARNRRRRASATRRASRSAAMAGSTPPPKSPAVPTSPPSGRSTLAPEPRIDNPAVVNGVNDAGPGTPPISRSLRAAAHARFSASIPLTGLRQRRPSGDLPLRRCRATRSTCASCNPTGHGPPATPRWPRNGLSLTDDGRVFFNSDRRLAPRDINQRRTPTSGTARSPELISTGVSPFDSSLLSGQRRRHRRLLLHP